MFRRPPRSTRTYTLFPYTSLFRSSLRHDTPARLAYRYRPAGLFQLFAGLFKVGVASIGAWHHQPLLGFPDAGAWALLGGQGDERLIKAGMLRLIPHIGQ